MPTVIPRVKICAFGNLTKPPADEVWMLITPSIDTWNDFDYELMVEVFLATHENVTHLSSARLLLQASKQTSPYLRSLSIATPTPNAEALKNQPFLFGFSSPEKYRYLVKTVGSDHAKALLREVHDWGALLAFDPTSPSLEAFIQSDGYTKGLLRYDAAFNAGIELEELLSFPEENGEDPNRVVIRCDVPMPYGPTLELSLDYATTPFGMTRINVLIGENGVGKTEVLRCLARPAEETTDLAAVYLDNEEPAPFDPDDDDDAETEDHDDAASLIHAQRHTLGWFRRVDFFPSAIDVLYRATQPVAGETISLATDPWSATTTDAWTVLRRAYDPAVDARRDWDILKRAMSGYLDLDRLYLPVTIGKAAKFKWIETAGGAYASVFKNRLGEERLLELFGALDETRGPIFVDDHDTVMRLSSGQRMFFRYGLALMRRVSRRSLFLLDEPELALHPQMIAALMRLTDSILQAKKSFAVVATHSLHLIREVPREAVHVLIRDQAGIPRDLGTYMQTFGADLSELSSVVFPDESIEELFEAKVDQTALAMLQEERATPTQAPVPRVRARNGASGERATVPNTPEQRVRSRLGGYLGSVGANYLRDTLKQAQAGAGKSDAKD
jgi:predicted ATPase